ncbi:hypothetical protein Tco_0425744 [Tanacetum coccineum]
MSMTIQSSVKDKILANSSESSKVENTPAEMLRDLDQQMEKRADDGKVNVVTAALSRKERVKPIRVRAMAMIIQYRVRGMILAAQSEAFKQENVPLVGSEMDEAHASSLKYLSENEIESSWILSLNFQGQSSEYDVIWVMVDRLTKLAHFLAIQEISRYAAESVSDAIGFEYCLTSSSGWIKSPVLWAEIGESSLIGPELVQETTDKVVLIKEKLKAARDRQKSYADNRRKPLEFEVGDRVMLKVSPWKGVIRFGKKGKLAPRYVGPFEILKRVSPVAYRLRLPEELSGIKVDKTLRFVEEPVENSDREVKRFLTSPLDDGQGSGSWMFLSFGAVMLLCVPFCGHAKLLAVRYLVQVSWNSKGNFEITWVWEDYLKDKYPRLLVWLVKPLVLTYESVVMYGLCVYMRYVDYVRVGNQSIERDRLIGIGLVMDLVKVLSFTFGSKEMTFVVLAFLHDF